MLIEKLDKRLTPRIQKWFEDLIDAVHCSSSHRSPAYEPTPYRTPRPETWDCVDTTDFRPRTNEDVPVPHGDVPLPQQGEGTVSQHIPARHSVHEFGSTSEAGTSHPSYDQVPARHTCPL